MPGIAPRRLAGWIIVGIGIGFTALVTAGDWLRLGQPFFSPEHRPAPTLADDPDAALFAVRKPRAAHYIVIGSRLALGVVATLAIAAPLLLPPRLVRRGPDEPQRPPGLQP